MTLSSADRRAVAGLVDDVARLKREVKLLASAKPGLAKSSIEGGSIDEYTPDGQLAQIIGAQHDGTHTTVSVAGPNPPTPWFPTASAIPGMAEIRWNGKFAGGALSPMDYKHTAAYLVPTGTALDLTSQAGVMTGELGDVLQVQAEAGVYDVYLVAWTLSGKHSAAAGPITIIVPAPVDTDAINDAFEQMDQALAEVQTSVNGKNSIRNAITDPDGDGGAEGDRWQKWSTLDVGGKLLASWRWDGTDWLAEAMDPAYLPKVDIGAGTFGTLDGERLDVASVRVKSIAVGDFANLATIDPAVGRNVVDPAYRTEVRDGWTWAAGTANYLMFKDRTDGLPFVEGDKLRITFEAIAEVDGLTHGVSLYLYGQDSSGSSSPNTGSNGPTLTFTMAPKTFDFIVTIPSLDVIAGGKSWIFGLRGGTTARRIGVRKVRAYKMNAGKLLLDGDLDARTITGPLIQSESAPNRGGKFTTAGLFAWNSVGTQTFTVDFTTGDVNMVGVFQTSGGGARAKLWNRDDAGTLDLYTGSDGQHGAVVSRPHTGGGFATGLMHFADDDSDAVAGVDLLSSREVRVFTRDLSGVINNQLTLATDTTGPYMQNAAVANRKYTGTGRIPSSNRPVVVTAAGTLGVLDNAAGSFHRLDLPQLPFRQFAAAGDQNAYNNQWVTWYNLTGSPGDQAPEVSGITMAGGVATVLNAGYYRIEAQISYSGNATGQRYCALLVNGYRWRYIQAPGGAGTVSVGFSRTLYLYAGSTVEMQGYQNSGQTLLMVGTNNADLTGWSIGYVSQ